MLKSSAQIRYLIVPGKISKVFVNILWIYSKPERNQLKLSVCNQWTVGLGNSCQTVRILESILLCKRDCSTLHFIFFMAGMGGHLLVCIHKKSA